MGGDETRGRPVWAPPTEPLDPERIAADFDALVLEGCLFGAEMSPSILKKSGTGASFLASSAPSRRALLARWADLFGNLVGPRDLFALLAPRFLSFEHRDRMLLFAKDRIIYDAQILHGGEPTGGLTLYLYAERDRSLGTVASLFRGKRLRIVYIERIHLKDQSSGYASALFRYYESLFHGLGFNQFRLKASLSVGKYYWAKEGFDCLERSDIARMRKELKDFARERGLPVREAEIDRLRHAYDVALFRRDLKVAAWRDGEGYYSLRRDEKHAEEFSFPLGKAFLLGSEPWDGYKVVYTNTPRRTGFVFSREYLSHRTRSGHRESRKRLERILAAVGRKGLRDSLVFLEPYPAERAFVEGIHGAEYLDRFRRAAAEGNRFFETTDCSISPESYDVALLAAGGVMAGIDAVVGGRVDNIFCAVRPPGHHAGKGYAMGFCFVNNVAVGAAYARAVHGIGRVFILDWDAHHGNGTQEIFEEDPDVFFCSLHEHPTFCFPGTGRRMERGKGRGAGTTLNLPLRPHAEDGEVVAAFEEEVLPAIDAFAPGLILVSAGFDGRREDTIADLDLTERSYVHMTRRLLEAADRHCGGRIVSVLEGGYDGPALASSVVAHIEALQGRRG